MENGESTLISLFVTAGFTIWQELLSSFPVSEMQLVSVGKVCYCTHHEQFFFGPFHLVGIVFHLENHTLLETRFRYDMNVNVVHMLEGDFAIVLSKT